VRRCRRFRMEGHALQRRCVVPPSRKRASEECRNFIGLAESGFSDPQLRDDPRICGAEARGVGTIGFGFGRVSGNVHGLAREQKCDHIPVRSLNSRRCRLRRVVRAVGLGTGVCEESKAKRGRRGRAHGAFELGQSLGGAPQSYQRVPQALHLVGSIWILQERPSERRRRCFPAGSRHVCLPKRSTRPAARVIATKSAGSARSKYRMPRAGPPR
jgi:hypothetical protein